MVKKKNKVRIINKTTTRSMLSMSHYKFRETLKQVSERFDTKVYVCCEAYTTKTCGMCGFIKEDMEGNTIYICDNCNMILDRDIIWRSKYLHKKYCLYLC
jgi:putative transposase